MTPKAGISDSTTAAKLNEVIVIFNCVGCCCVNPPARNVLYDYYKPQGLPLWEMIENQLPVQGENNPVRGKDSHE